MAFPNQKSRDKLKTRLHRFRQRFHWFPDLPTEIKDHIIRHLIPPFIAKIDIEHNHRCRANNEGLFRWKVTGIPQAALNLQLVNREVRALAHRRMIKECCGLSTSGPIMCNCHIHAQGLFKHTEVVYRLQDMFLGSAIQTIPVLYRLRQFAAIRISIEEWKKILHVRDNLYVSERSRDWNVAWATDRVIVVVLERSLLGVSMACGVGSCNSIFIVAFRARVAMMAEMQIRFLAPAIASRHLRSQGSSYVLIRSIEKHDQDRCEQSSACPCPLSGQGATDYGGIARWWGNSEASAFQIEEILSAGLNDSQAEQTSIR